MQYSVCPVFGEMASTSTIVCITACFLLAGSGYALEEGTAVDDVGDNFGENLLSLLREEEAKLKDAVEEEFDESNVETKDIMLPETSIAEEGGTFCHAEELAPNEQFIVGFQPIIATDDVNHLALYGCLQGPASKENEWQCSREDTVCAGPSVLMYDWKEGGCDNYLARGELITIGGRYITHVVLVVGYEKGGYESSSGITLKLMSTDFKDTPGLTKTVEYFSSAFNYVSECPDEETPVSEDPDEEEHSSEEVESSKEVSSESQDASQTVDGNEIREENDIEDENESISAYYESSLPRYDSSYSESAMEVEYYVPDEASYDKTSNDVFNYDYSQDSSIEALVNYLAQYWDTTFLGMSSLTSSGWWPRQDIPIGQIAGLDIDAMGHLVLFRRGERSWKPNDFDSENVYIHDTPIQAQTLVVVDPMSGDILEAWGKDRFYLPHGLTIDHENNLWLTDVAMHQVFKFSSDSDLPAMTFGQPFRPGSDQEHLCKPTDVAICPKTGDIFIADGYCNSRVVKFSSNGTFLFEITAHNYDDTDKDSDLAKFRIPHSVTMVESKGWICVADRENARIQCFVASDGTFAAEFASAEFGREVFAIAYNPIEDVLYAVNGPRLHRADVPTAGFTIDLDSGEILDSWTPSPEHFGVLHDIAVSQEDGTVFVADIEMNRVWRFEKDSDVLNNMIY